MKYMNKNLKTIYFLCLLLSSVIAHPQEIKEKQLRTLSSLGLPFQNFDRTNENITADFRKILQLEKRRKGLKITGSILLPVGVAVAGLGVSMISNYKKSYRREVDGEYGYELGEYTIHPLYSEIGSGLVVIGSAHIAISIPMIVFSGKKKRKRDQLLSKFGVAPKID